MRPAQVSRFCGNLSRLQFAASITRLRADCRRRAGLRRCRKPDLDAPHDAHREGKDEQDDPDHPVFASGIDTLRLLGELGFQVVKLDRPLKDGYDRQSTSAIS